jgi:hypothetical protein
MLPFVLSTVTSLMSRLPATRSRLAPGTIHRPALSEEEMAQWSKSLVRCHRHRDFFFLDLPLEVRTLIYTNLFIDNVVQVCSYAKDKTSTSFADNERCQILLTNKKILREARQIYYTYSNWRFCKVSSLNCIAWGDGANVLKQVQDITITNPDVVVVFGAYVSFFTNLKVMTIDFPTRMTLATKLVREDHLRIAKRVRFGDWWKVKVGAYLPLAKQRRFIVKVGLHVVYEDDSDDEVRRARDVKVAS